MKIKTKKPQNSFPKDTWLRLDAVLSTGQIMPVLGIYRRRGIWHNDINARTFKTITEAKEYAFQLVKGGSEHE